MKKAVALITICALLFSLASLSYAEAKQVTVKGILEAAAKDEAGNVTSVQLVAGADKYKVADNEKGKELLKLGGKTVEATGTVAVAQDGAKTITVLSYKIAM